MADITLTYKGSTIAEMNVSGSKTLKTAGKYCEGDIGVSYVKPSGGGSTDNEDAIIKRTLTSYSNQRVTTLGSSAFSFCSSLKDVNFPLVTTMGTSCFSACYNLESVSMPLLTEIPQNSFTSCNLKKTKISEFTEYCNVWD